MKLNLFRLALALAYGLASSATLAAVERDSHSLYAAIRGDTGADLLINIIVAAVGGITHSVFLLKADKIVQDWKRQITIDALVSSFAGLLVFALLERLDSDPFTQLALVGIGGWLGGSTVDALAKKYYGVDSSHFPPPPPPVQPVQPKQPTDTHVVTASVVEPTQEAPKEPQSHDNPPGL